MVLGHDQSHKCTYISWIINILYYVLHIVVTIASLHCCAIIYLKLLTFKPSGNLAYDRNIFVCELAGANMTRNVEKHFQWSNWILQASIWPEYICKTYTRVVHTQKRNFSHQINLSKLRKMEFSLSLCFSAICFCLVSYFSINLVPFAKKMFQREKLKKRLLLLLSIRVCSNQLKHYFFHLLF
jgi:hypothetical protein